MDTTRIEPTTDGAVEPGIGGAVDRRRFLQTASAVAVGAAALGSTRPVAAQAGTDLTDWFSDVSNFDGVVDERGTTRVTVAVGADGNGGGFAFDPPAVRVDPGTTVHWEWTGAGGSHDVAAEDGTYGSPMQGNPGDTFEHAFESAGVSLYACTPHKAMGMKGAVVVGDEPVTVTTPTPAPTPTPAYLPREPDYGSWFDGVDGYDGTVDMRGRDEVRIRIGADGNGGGFAVDPPAVAVDPKTRVIWEWVGTDGPHELTAADGSYASPAKSTGEWGLFFDGVGVSTYVCSSHGDAGMRGAVVVGDVFEGVHEVTTSHLAVFGVLGAALLSPLAFGAFLWNRTRNREL